jgi:hypothetical protein
MEKSKIQLAKEKCQTLLKFFTEQSVEKFETVKVKDSDTQVDYPEFKVGAEVSVSTPTGSEPISDGHYVLSNSAEFDAKDGKISKITKDVESATPEAKPEADKPVADKADDTKLADAPVEGSPEEEATETPADEAKENSDMQVLTDRVTQLEDAVKSILEAISDAPSKDDVQDFNKKVEALSKIPTQLSADNRVEIKESELDKFKRIANSFKK